MISVFLVWFGSRVQLQMSMQPTWNIQMLKFISQSEEIQAFTKTHKTQNAEQERQFTTAIKVSAFRDATTYLIQHIQNRK